MKCRVAACSLAALLAVGVRTASADLDRDKAPIRIDLDHAPAGSSKSEQPKTTPAAAPNTGKPAAAPAKKADGKKKEAPAKIDGMEVSRGDRGYLGLKVDHGTFKISFYGRDKKPVAVDVSSAVLRWPVHYQPNDERDFLTPSSDGKALTSAKVIRAPFNFKLYITLLQNGPNGEAKAQEEYIVDFQQ